MMRPTIVAAPLPEYIVVPDKETTMTMTTPHHTGGLKFSIGQAVYIAKLPDAYKDVMNPIPGVIRSMGQQFATVRTDAGNKRVVFMDLIPRGYCASCDQAAIVNDAGALICPRCAGNASAPVPYERLPQWENHQLLYDMRYEMLTTGCAQKEARRAALQRRDAREAETDAGRRAAQEAVHEERMAEYRKQPSYRLIGVMVDGQKIVDAMEPARAVALIDQIEQLLAGATTSAPAVRLKPTYRDADGDLTKEPIGPLAYHDFEIGDGLTKVLIGPFTDERGIELLINGCAVGSGCVHDPQLTFSQLRELCDNLTALLDDPRVVAALGDR